MAIPWRKLTHWAAGVTVGLVALAWHYLHVSDLTLIGTGYAAEQTCACLHVSGRSLESCLTDLDPLARKFVTVHPGEHEVTATILGYISATALYEQGFGCSLRD